MAEKVENKARRDVDTIAPDIEADEKRHRLCRLLRSGVEAMRQASLDWEVMLPNPGELEPVNLGGNVANLPVVDYGVELGQAEQSGTFTVYELRVLRTPLLNVWADTVGDTARLPFRSRIQLDGWDQELMGEVKTDADGNVLSAVPGWVDNLDGEGRSLDEWAADVFEDALAEGISYGFVDNDPRQFRSPQDRREAGGRPWCVKISRSQVRRITLERAEDGAPRLKQIVFCEPIRNVDVSDPNDWTDEEIDARKVVTAGQRAYTDADGIEHEATPVTVRVYKKAADGKSGWVEDTALSAEIRPDDPRKTLTEIPLVPFYGRRIAPYRGESPFRSTAFTMAAVWAQTSELINKARETALSYLHETGLDGDEGSDAQPINADTRNARYRYSSDSQAKLNWVEQSGESLEALQKLVEWLIDRIEDSHRQLRSSRPTGAVTAREITLEGVHASSALEMWTIFHEAGWQKVLELMAYLGGHRQTGTVSIPHDFGLPSSGMERNHDLFLAGRMTAKNYWAEAIRAGDVSETDFDVKAETDLEREERQARDAEAAAARELAGAGAFGDLGALGEGGESEEPEN